MNLHLILGDQLSTRMSSFQGFDPTRDAIALFEVGAEATSVRHHKKKLAFIFSAMRHFAGELSALGYTVIYVKLDDENNTGTFSGEVERHIELLRPQKIILTEPSEYRVLKIVESWRNDLSIPIEIRPDDRFISSKEEFASWAHGRKQLRMEFFYRDMRRKTMLLMENNEPVGGSWNFDAQNREPPKSDLEIPEPFQVEQDAITQEVMQLVSDRFNDHFGECQPFHYAVTRQEALNALDDFIEKRLPLFGDYQDAMILGEPWMFHSHISMYINVGLLDPLECCKKAERAFQSGRAPLNAVEGFIRQIIGWREYVRGIYWLKMPGYQAQNYFDANRALPPLYWGAMTRMRCLQEVVKETREQAYAHHIQRLMVLGNFALLTGVDPQEVNEWFLIVYADAFEWVEMPNVSGMALFADGGLLASKPYAAGGAYISRMSNYCKSCSYSVSRKTGEKACPFNYLYWDFLDRNHAKLKGNNRLSIAYRTLEKMSDEKRKLVRDESKRFLKRLDRGEIV